MFIFVYYVSCIRYNSNIIGEIPPLESLNNNVDLFWRSGDIRFNVCLQQAGKGIWKENVLKIIMIKMWFICWYMHVHNIIINYVYGYEHYYKYCEVLFC